MRRVTDTQVRRLMEEMSKHGRVGHAAMLAGMDRKTASKYIAAGTLPSQVPSSRSWRTRKDPFNIADSFIHDALLGSPGLEAKTLLAMLQDQFPNTFHEGQLRTLQRKVQRWHAEHDEDRQAFLAQRHRAGEAAQTDFTHATQLGVTLDGLAFAHLLCVFVLPFSNWLWATVCASESLLALRKGVQRALFQLGRVPLFHQTDNSTSATHLPKSKAGDVILVEKRKFNEEYLSLMKHLGMTPRTTEIGAKEQNGDVEAANGALKRRLAQALLVRGSKDFVDLASYQTFVDGVVRGMNQARGSRVAEELQTMRELQVEKLAEYVEEKAIVSEWSTIRVRRNAYSVPTRLIGEELRVRVYEDQLEVFHRDKLLFKCARIQGRGQHTIDYRHVVRSLLLKPGGFERYIYREEMFPTQTFRRAYDALEGKFAGVKRDLEYLRMLHLAATTMESEVELAIRTILEEGNELCAESVKDLVELRRHPETPKLAPLQPSFAGYDALIARIGT